MNLEDLYKSVPDTEYFFKLKETEGNTTKVKFSGDFKGLIPTNKMRSAIKRKEAAMNSGLESEYNKKLIGLPYPQILDTHEKIAYLSVVLLECPEWVKDSRFGELLKGDMNIISELYEQILKHENNWYEAVWGTDEKPPKEK